jgi:hypothetical protein
MFWVVGLVVDLARDTIREFRNTPFDKAVDVERDSPNRNCLVTVVGNYQAVFFNKESNRAHVFVSGLKNFNPRSESRRLS